MGRKAQITEIRVDENLIVRRQLNQDAVARYRELYLSGQSKALIVQKGTMKLLDGHHRLEAARHAGIKELWVEEREVEDKDLLAEVFRCNRAHGVPLSTDERNNLIRRLYFESGWTQQQIANLTGLTQQGVSRILAVKDTSCCDADTADKRVRLRDEDMPAVARLILGGSSHEEVALRFGVARTTVTMRWNEFRDEIKRAYESGLLKREVGERFSLAAEEADLILRQYDPEPLNFTPASGSLWTGLKIDERFGTKGYPGSLPAALVKNLLYYYSRAGDVVIDPFAGGATVADCCADMVGRRCYAYDLFPIRPDIKQHDILSGPPPCPEEPDVVFLDPPYSLVAKGKYPGHPSQLGEMEVSDFLEAMEKVFGYWDKGTLILVMGCLRRNGEFYPLPHECAKRLEEVGWKIVDWLVNELHRPESETGLAIAREREYRVPRRTDVSIIVAKR